jgi:hypothetical protein
MGIVFVQSGRQKVLLMSKLMDQGRLRRLRLEQVLSLLAFCRVHVCQQLKVHISCLRCKSFQRKRQLLQEFLSCVLRLAQPPWRQRTTLTT